MVHIALQKRRVATTEKKNHLHFRKNLSTNHNQAHPNLCQKGKNHSIHGIIVWTPHWFIELTKKSLSGSIHTHSVCSKATWFSQSPTTVLSAPLSWNNIQFYSDCKISCPRSDNKLKKLSWAAWNLMLSQRHNFLNHHRARNPITLNQQGTMDTRAALLSSVGAQDIHPSGYQVSHLEAIGFHWEDLDLKMDALDRA